MAMLKNLNALISWGKKTATADSLNPNRGPSFSQYALSSEENK